jgi:hypothetical protein
MKITTVDGILLCRPTREEVEALAVGDLVIDCFGKLTPVVRIAYRGLDINGKAYVGWDQRFGPDGSTSTISGSITEGEPIITIPAGSRWKRSENYPV